MENAKSVKEKSGHYHPVSCKFYDQLEAWATMKTKLDIIYQNRPGESLLISGQIKDLYTREKCEYLMMESGVEIQLDLIDKVTASSED
ncbi:MAG: hypothetical protein KDC80_19545 [Saprospiraceae bacterium]|nr:hypothetical protein [Saprospiraceae bacterium]